MGKWTKGRIKDRITTINDSPIYKSLKITINRTDGTSRDFSLDDLRNIADGKIELNTEDKLLLFEHLLILVTKAGVVRIR